MNENTFKPGQAIDLELMRKCMRFSDTPEATGTLRVQLLTSGQIWETLYENAAHARLAPALHWRLKERGLLPPVPKAKHSELLAPAEVLQAIFEESLIKRAQMRERLAEIITTLNAKEIIPVLIKGARHLWLEDAPWRTLRDLDLLIPGKDAERAQALLNSIGYKRDDELPDRPNRHHLAPLFRNDLFGWVEIHRRAANPYAEQFLRTAQLVQHAQTIAKDGCTAAILSETDHIWHGLLHHHFGHSGFARGLLDFKGLFEFAALFRDLDETQRFELKDKAAQSALGLAALELWLAAADAELGLGIDNRIAIGDDARSQAENWMSRSDGNLENSVKYPGYREMLAMGWNNARGAQVSKATGANWLLVKMSVPAMLAPKIRRA